MNRVNYSHHYNVETRKKSFKKRIQQTQVGSTRVLATRTRKVTPHVKSFFKPNKSGLSQKKYEAFGSNYQRDQPLSKMAKISGKIKRKNVQQYGQIYTRNAVSRNLGDRTLGDPGSNSAKQKNIFTNLQKKLKSSKVQCFRRIIDRTCITRTPNTPNPSPARPTSKDTPNWSAGISTQASPPISPSPSIQGATPLTKPTFN